MNKVSEKGAVLIITLFILAALALISVDMSRDSLLDSAYAAASQNSLAAKPALQSAEYLVARFLTEEFQKEKTEEGDESFAAFQKRFQTWLASYAEKFERHELTIELEDENSRFPVRALFPLYSSDKAKAEYYAQWLENMLASLLVMRGYDGGDGGARAAARKYVGELMAWGGRATLSDESLKWYLSREPAYIPPGRAPESLAELTLVRWPDMDEELARNVLTGEDGLPGLLENCSVWAKGPININTMRTVVGWGLRSDYESAKGFMAALEEAREAGGERLPAGWYKDTFFTWGVPEPPSSAVNAGSRWYRVRSSVRAGAAINKAEAVGWLTPTRLTWVSRSFS